MKDRAASVRQRLLNGAKKSGDVFDLVLARYALERLLYRLSVSRHAENFILKGALLFLVWGHADHRPTRDADLLAFGSSEPEHLAKLFREICAIPFEDGIAFDPETVAAIEIAEDKTYSGARITLRARLAKADIPVQVDIGFGDAITPAPQVVEYPALLEFPTARLRAYPVYTVIAEKFHAIVALGEANSRMKDFYDLWVISRRFALEDQLLAQAVAATFERRKTLVPADLPVALTPEFSDNEGKKRQWAAFLQKNGLGAQSVTLAEVQEAVAAMVLRPLHKERK